MKYAIAVALFAALVVGGCGRKSNGGTQLAGLVTTRGLANAGDIRMIVYQPAGFGPLPMPSQMPLRGEPLKITAPSDVMAIFDAVNVPSGHAETRQARNNRLALIGRTGEVVVFGITTPTIYGCDITREHASAKLGPALISALKRAKIAKFALTSPVQSATYRNGAGASCPIQVTNRAMLYELLSHYSPLALKGNRRCRTDELRRHSRRVPHFITVRLARPDTFEAVVASRNQEWPPNVYDSSTRLEQVKFDTITVFHEGNGLVRLVFTDTQTNECLFSDPVGSLRLLKAAQGRNPPVYGPDLFDQVVAEMKKP